MARFPCGRCTMIAGSKADDVAISSTTSPTASVMSYPSYRSKRPSLSQSIV